MSSRENGHSAPFALSRRGFLHTGLLGVGSMAVLTWGDRLSEPVAQAGAQALRPVSFRLNFNPNAEHAPYYLGKKKGFYAEQGVDLNLLPGTGPATTVTLVGSGDTMVGVAVADAVTVARAQRVPVVSLGLVHQRIPTGRAPRKCKSVTKTAAL